MLTSVGPEWRWPKRSLTKRECSTCSSWYHTTCAGVSSPSTINTEIILPYNGCAHPATIEGLHTKATIASIRCQDVSRMGSNNAAREAIRVWEIFTSYFFEEGAVPRHKVLCSHLVWTPAVSVNPSCI
ncbi:uncharacterized protein ACWYII_002620 [Salvelinus alpinus]